MTTTPTRASARIRLHDAGEPSGHIKEPYTLAEIKAKIASNDYSAEMLLQHAMLLLDSQPAATGRIAELEDALYSCLQLVNQLNEHHIPDGCSRLIRHIKDAAATVSKAQASATADGVLEDATRLLDCQYLMNTLCRG